MLSLFGLESQAATNPKRQYLTTREALNFGIWQPENETRQSTMLNVTPLNSDFNLRKSQSSNTEIKSDFWEKNQNPEKSQSCDRTQITLSHVSLTQRHFTYMAHTIYFPVVFFLSAHYWVHCKKTTTFKYNANWEVK